MVSRFSPPCRANELLFIASNRVAFARPAAGR
jgi:hypothetical protein